MVRKIRIALALSLLLVILSTLAAEARPATPSPSITVGAWEACQQAGGNYVITASNIKVSNLSKYQLVLSVVPVSGPAEPGDVVAQKIGAKKSPGLQWTSSTDPLNPGYLHPEYAEGYSVRVFAKYNDGWSWTYTDQFVFFANLPGCQMAP